MTNQLLSESPHFADDGSLLAPQALDHFAFFGLPRQLNLDVDRLESEYFLLSRKLHPDFFVGRDPQQQIRSLELSAALNNAYRVLREPVSRAEYLLELETKIPFGESGETGQVSTELLGDVLEIKERLLDLDTAEGDERISLVTALQANKEWSVAHLQAIDAGLETVYHDWDSASAGESSAERTAEILSDLKSLLSRRRYFSGLVREIDKVLIGGGT